MIVSVSGRTATVTREKGDTPVRGGTRSTAETAFYGRVRDALRKQGLDVVRKEMAKDGHMVADGQPYVRARDGSFCLWDVNYAIRDIAEEYNGPDGTAVLFVEGEFPRSEAAATVSRPS